MADLQSKSASWRLEIGTWRLEITLLYLTLLPKANIIEKQSNNPTDTPKPLVTILSLVLSRGWEKNKNFQPSRNFFLADRYWNMGIKNPNLMKKTSKTHFGAVPFGTILVPCEVGEFYFFPAIQEFFPAGCVYSFGLKCPNQKRKKWKSNRKCPNGWYHIGPFGTEDDLSERNVPEGIKFRGAG